MKRPSILLVDDHVMLLDALSGLLRQDFDVVGVAQNGNAMLEMARRLLPDIVLLDISMPQLNGIDALRILRKEENAAQTDFASFVLECRRCRSWRFASWAEAPCPCGAIRG